MSVVVNALGESVNLAVLDGDEIVYVAHAEPSKNFMRMFTEVGHRAKVHTTAVGKVMLSTRSDQYVRDVLRRTGMERLTEHTITTPEAFLADLERVRARGYAIDHGEQEIGVCCVAVPVPMAPRPMALSMSGPLPRMTDEMIARAVPLLREAASRISADLAGPASLSEVEVTA
jgi:IclR family acetate operon transcriptional repressor